MQSKEYKTNGVCMKKLTFDYEDGIVYNLKFMGGCDGNLKAIAKLCEGKKMQDLIGVLSGNTCGFKTTSCADQLVQAFKEVI